MISKVDQERLGDIMGHSLTTHEALFHSFEVAEKCIKEGGV